MSQRKIANYTCECGKQMSGEYNKMKMLIKLHHKRCIHPQKPEESPIVVDFDVLNAKSHIRVSGVRDTVGVRDGLNKIGASVVGINIKN